MLQTKLIAIVSVIILMSFKNQQQEQITIAAASDLKFALDSIITGFKKMQPNADISVTYGSSGKLYEQILNDAPFDLYFSADITYPRSLREKGVAISEMNTYGIGKIVLWSKKLDPSKDKMNSLLDSSVQKISIANPAHAPYGKAAEQSLKYYKIYDQVKDKLVNGENIAQAAQFITSGAADIGVIALSLALSPAMQKEGGKYYVIPDESHSRLQQAFVILKHADGNKLAKTFSDYITSTSAKETLKFYGFTTK
jgi:molybdate transport system substrate-binding protein